uniref:Uncharacterized protein n=1 Tax=Melopsittacus undulatus TaxID=13146 RepID=A0A8C6JUQ2_MELUD
MVLSPGLTEVQKPISFGTCQERKMFPLYNAPDRLGIQLKSIRGQPSLGPGCYLSQEVSLAFLLGAFPSWKTPRTGKSSLLQTVTPSPASYQPFQKKEREFQPAYAPFSTKTPRFPYFLPVFFRPGTYKADKQLHQRITWPMKFGSPDWSLVPMPPKRMLKTEITIDKEFLRHRNRVAYLSLYFS